VEEGVDEVGTSGRTCDKGKASQIKMRRQWMDLRRRESCCKRRRWWWRRLHDPGRPIILWDILWYSVRSGVKRAARTSGIPSARTTTRRGIIRIHVRVVATRTRCSGVIVLGPLAFLLANTVHTRARVDRIVDGPIRTLAPVSQRSGHFFETWVQGEVVADGILECRWC